VGAGGLDIHNCEAELRQFVNANALAPWVTFTGNVPNVEEYLQAADLFVFPTENDAFPSSLVEAMACGLPVISTPVGAIPTLIAHECNGLLVEAANEQALSQAVVRLLSDRALAERLSHAARKSVQDHYSADTVTRAYLGVFQALTPPRSRASLAGPRPGRDYE
jgi:glycosyltransferase involved in cell wall biosynthesis